jgi:hypothetical protein
VDVDLQAESKSYFGRDGLVCVHGNRFIQWASLRALGFKPGEQFSNYSQKVPGVVTAVVAAVVAAVKKTYADSYPASLFKNLAKCRVLASQIE